MDLCGTGSSGLWQTWQWNPNGFFLSFPLPIDTIPWAWEQTCWTLTWLVVALTYVGSYASEPGPTRRCLRTAPGSSSDLLALSARYILGSWSRWWPFFMLLVIHAEIHPQVSSHFTQVHTFTRSPLSGRFIFSSTSGDICRFMPESKSNGKHFTTYLIFGAQINNIFRSRVVL